jgi:hypothetical protein
MELPAGPPKSTSKIAGIAAVYVARLPSGACQIGISRDLKQTMIALRRQGHDLTIVGAFWVDEIKVATRIASRVNKTIRHGGPITDAEAAARIAAIAADIKVHLTEYGVVIKRVESAMAHVKAALEQARKNGGLQWFNRAFQNFRLQAKACGHRSMT